MILRWNKEEINILKENYMTNGESYISKILNRSENCIRVRAIQSGLYKLKERGKINLYTVLSLKTPVITPEMAVLVEVENKIQSEQLENEKNDLVQYLRKELKNYKIKIETIVTDNPEKKNLVYTPQDKYNRMAEKNPSIQELKKRLDLDVEY